MRILFISIFLYLSFLSCAQNGYGNQYIFGYGPSSTTILAGATLNFNNDTVTLTQFPIQMKIGATSTVMCDSMGVLLFYSNGCHIANANHVMMTNGDSIHGQNPFNGCSSPSGSGSALTQSVIALPKPGSLGLYYLFNLDFQVFQSPSGTNTAAPLNINYAVIDMSLENGLGAVVEKNVSIVQDTLAWIGIQACRHRNGKDWWVVMPEYRNDCYWSMLLTENGIDTVFEQCTGLGWIAERSLGQTVFSPNSKKYVRFEYYNGLHIYDFDDSTGLFSNPLQIDFMDLDTFNYNGISFSSNSRFMYASTYRQLYQLDTWATDMAASRILIADLWATPPSNTQYPTRFVYSRLAPDGKIYIAGGLNSEHIHVIHHPNCYGLECGVEQYSMYLGTYNFRTMPNMPHYKHWSESDTCNATSALPEVPYSMPFIRFYPNPTSESLLAQGLENGDVLVFFDVSGRLLKRVVYDNGSIRIDDLGKGLYVVKVFRRGEYKGVSKVLRN